MLCYPCHSFYTAKDKISNHDGVELNGVIVEPYEAEFVDRLSGEGISSDRGEEVKSLLECCIVKFFFECGKVMGVECDFDRQHGLRPIRQHERRFSRCSLFGRTD